MEGRHAEDASPPLIPCKVVSTSSDGALVSGAAQRVVGKGAIVGGIIDRALQPCLLERGDEN